MSEKDIISAVMKGDRKAFEELYRLHWANLVGYASLIAGPKHSKDIVHDIFLKVWLNRTSLLEKDTLRPYLMRAVYNMSLNVLRNTARQQPVDNLLDNQIDFLAAQEYDPDRSEIIRRLYDNETKVQIEDAVRQLPERCQIIFRQSYMEGKSHKEIAENMGISLSTVDNQIYKALKILRTLLSESSFLVMMWLMAK